MPTITGTIASRQAFLPADYQFIRSRTDRRIKMSIPGPLTIMDSAKDEYYGNEVSLAMDLAAAIRQELEVLADAGCEIIQFDEPIFHTGPAEDV